MVRGKAYSEQCRIAAVIHQKDGLSHKEVVKQLQKQGLCSRNEAPKVRTIQDWAKKATQPKKEKKKMGRPTIVDFQLESDIARCLRRYREGLSIMDLTRVLQSECGHVVSRWTVARYIKASPDISVQKKKFVFQLTPQHKAARLEWAEKNQNRDFVGVCFSDEKLWVGQKLLKEKVFGPAYRGPKRARLLQAPPTYYTWGMIGTGHPCVLVEAPKHMTTDGYLQMLDRTLRPTGADLFLLQDNAKWHAVGRREEELRTLLGQKGFSLCPIPPRSPDLNPIENIWGTMTKKVYKGGALYTTVEALQKAVHKAFREVCSESVCAKLTADMQERCRQVIAAKGDYPLARC